MKTAIIIGLIGSMLTHNVGIAENEHYINFPDKTGYYIENDLGIEKGNVCLIVNGNIFVIDDRTE